MAEIASTTFSQNDSANTGALPGLSGTSPPSQIDNSIRALMGATKREHDWRNLFLTSGGSSNAYTLTYTVAPAAYYTGQVFSFTANFGCTGSATLNVNGLGAKTIKKDVAGTMTALSSGDIASGAKVIVSYDGTDFIWTNWQGAASVPSGALTSSGYTMATARLIGRTTASTGAPEEISIGSGLSMSAGSLSATGGSAVVSCVVQTFTSSGTWTKPSGLLFAEVEVQAPGGGSGGSTGNGSSVGIAGSGGAGGYCKKLYMAADLSATETVTVGSPGTGGASGGNAGTAGGNSTFKGMTANGGALGSAGAFGSAAVAKLGGEGGTATGGDINISGEAALVGYRASGTVGFSGRGGRSVLGKPATQVNDGASGDSGTGYGQGARGAFTTYTAEAGANGGSGITIIKEYKSV